ncbi:hypothetical protein RQP46_003943 [Phenoliferia psychrophenolica]
MISVIPLAWESGREKREASRLADAARRAKKSASNQRYSDHLARVEEKRNLTKKALSQRKKDMRATAERETLERRNAADARGDFGVEEGTILETAVERMKHCLRVNYDAGGGGGYDSDDSDYDDFGEFGDGGTGLNRHELDDLEVGWFAEAMNKMRSEKEHADGSAPWYERELVEDYDAGRAVSHMSKLHVMGRMVAETAIKLELRERGLDVLLAIAAELEKTPFHDDFSEVEYDALRLYVKMLTRGMGTDSVQVFWSAGCDAKGWKALAGEWMDYCSLEEFMDDSEREREEEEVSDDYEFSEEE